MSAGRAGVRNTLVTTLSAKDFSLLTGGFEEVSLTSGTIIERANAPSEYVYFPESGIASVIAIDGAERRMEAGPFGREGMSGAAVLLEAEQSPNDTQVQIGGTANRVAVDDLRRMLASSPALHRHFLRYVYAFAIQTAHTALAAGLGVVEQRLARWLLMVHDRVDGDEFELTHEFMALMLAVRRPGVTVALHGLEGRALIRSLRGRVIIRDRSGLEDFCKGIYGVPEREYRRLILNDTRPSDG